MVLYFTSKVVDPPAFIYVGKDKVENEDLIAHGWPEDVWFHVDNLSSAHIYVRLRADQGETWDKIPEELLTDCAQLTKANSIEGNKKDNVTIIYTPWSNLKKSGDMATGQVGFKDHKMVRRCYVEKRENAIVNRLNKTKVEKYPDLRQEKMDREREVRKKERIAAQEKKKEEQKTAEERAQLKYQKDHMYDDLHTEENLEMSNNQDRDADFLDDFM
ncbi:Coiled-coil domain-containing protein 25 [Meristemomyces frigidus]|nr:Coiled-coil domain-containing protein 25 [Meristemomyces frigidus]